MLKWIESTGKTEEAAVEAALAKLGLDRDDVSVEVLERAKSGFLGIGSCPAKVKVTYEAPDGAEAAPRIELDERGNYQVELVGQNLGTLIGRRGETLDAIQQLTVYAVNRGLNKRVRIHLDAEHYRAKREESLERLANKVAAKVVKYRRNVTLEPMNAYERHVIHTALQEYPDIATYSVGTEPNRRTVVAYSRGEPR